MRLLYMLADAILVGFAYNIPVRIAAIALGNRVPGRNVLIGETAPRAPQHSPASSAGDLLRRFLLTRCVAER